MAPKKVKVVDATNPETEAIDIVEHRPVSDEQTHEEFNIATPTDTAKEEEYETPPNSGNATPTEQEVKEEQIVEVQQQPSDAEKTTRTNELVKCEKCGKYVTQKTLKYTHHKTCSANTDKQTKPKKKEEVEHEPPAVVEEAAPVAPPPTKLERQKSTYIKPNPSHGWDIERHTPTLAPEPKLSFDEMRRQRLKQRADQRTLKHISLFANAI